MLKIGKIPFRDVAFPYYFIEKNENFNFEFYSAYPPQLGEMVLNNKIDIAPVSSIIYAKNPENFLILPDFSIYADGDTGSIYLISKDEEISSICLPSNSATAVEMVKIIMMHKGKNVNFKFFNPKDGMNNEMNKCDAALFIGDDGIRAREKFENKFKIIDVGREWKEITKKGAVYALWLINKNSAYEKKEEIKFFHKILKSSIEYAYKNFDKVINEIKGNLKEEYVKFHILSLSYELKENNIDALINFYEYAKRYGIIYNIPELKFFKI